MKKTLKDLQNDIATASGVPGRGIVEYIKNLSGLAPEWLSDELAQIIDDCIEFMQGSRTLFPALQYVEPSDLVANDVIILTIASHLRSHSFSYEELLETEKHLFNPTYNYDKHETVTTTDKKNEQTTGTVSEGARSTSSLNEVYPDASDSGQNESKLTNSSQAVTDTTGGTYTTNNTLTTTTETTGNIGVTTSTQMIGEVLTTMRYGVADIIARDIAGLIAGGVYYAL